MIGCLRTRVRKQPIIALYFESELVLRLKLLVVLLSAKEPFVCVPCLILINGLRNNVTEFVTILVKILVKMQNGTRSISQARNTLTSLCNQYHCGLSIAWKEATQINVIHKLELYWPTKSQIEMCKIACAVSLSRKCVCHRTDTPLTSRTQYIVCLLGPRLTCTATQST